MFLVIEGTESTSALDVLVTNGLINYFGNCSNLDQFRFVPLIFQKGHITICVYGISCMDEKLLSRLLKEGRVR